MTKILSVMLHISETIHHIIVIYGIHLQNGNISRSSFHFLKILIFQVVSRVKGKKMAQNDKKLYLLYSISLKPYIVWLSFMVHMCKRISLGFVFIFSEFWCFRLLRGWKGKKRFKMTKNSVCCASYLKNHTWYDFHLWYTCVKGYL